MSSYVANKKNYSVINGIVEKQTVFSISNVGNKVFETKCSGGEGWGKKLFSTIVSPSFPVRWTMSIDTVGCSKLLETEINNKTIFVWPLPGLCGVRRHDWNTNVSQVRHYESGYAYSNTVKKNYTIWLIRLTPLKSIWEL